MVDIPIDSPEKHETFLELPRKHILMITNHGIHQWEIIPGLQDTGGQNVFVNEFTRALVKRGFKVTIANRGGYPHPVTGEEREGLHYKDEHQRILYLEDDVQEFVRKEDMVEQISDLVDFLETFLEEEGSDIDLIISHYWDGANVGVEYNQRCPNPVKHIWVPHSLGAIKKRNVSDDRWEALRIDERIEIEQELVKAVDGAAATSATIEDSLKEDYDYRGPDLFLPSCIDTDRFHPRKVKDDHPIWEFLSARSGLKLDQVRDAKIVTEISRTDTTKRKNVLIKAFAKARQAVPDSLLVVSIDENAGELAQELKDLIKEQDVDDYTAVVGNVWDRLPVIYAVTDLYCTPSVMEGFGMSVQEAAATKVPVVSSNLVPFVAEYLMDEEGEELWYDQEKQEKPLRQGCGAIMVPADDVDGFAYAIEMLLTDDDLRQEMANNAYQITIPYFTWENMVEEFLEKIEVKAA